MIFISKIFLFIISILTAFLGAFLLGGHKKNDEKWNGNELELRKNKSLGFCLCLTSFMGILYSIFSFVAIFNALFIGMEWVIFAVITGFIAGSWILVLTLGFRKGYNGNLINKLTMNLVIFLVLWITLLDGRMTVGDLLILFGLVFWLLIKKLKFQIK